MIQRKENCRHEFLTLNRRPGIISCQVASISPFLTFPISLAQVPRRILPLFVEFSGDSSAQSRPAITNSLAAKGLSESNFTTTVLLSMQSQLACSGCRNVLLYPRGAANVRCALCNTVTPVQSAGMEMDHLICGVCRTLLMYTRGATSVRCMCCHTVNLTPMSLAPASNQVTTVNCGGCRITLMYPVGAPSVKCAVCQYITNVGAPNGMVPVQRQYGSNQVPSTSNPPTNIQSQTVVVENPMSRDESGKLVSNVVVGVTAERK